MIWFAWIVAGLLGIALADTIHENIMARRKLRDTEAQLRAMAQSYQAALFQCQSYSALNQTLRSELARVKIKQ